MSRITIPIGPQHPALKEPISFLLTAEGERIVESILRIGYVHRGLERIFQNRNYVQNVHVAERVCGICSHVHTTAYCQGVEALLATCARCSVSWSASTVICSGWVYWPNTLALQPSSCTPGAIARSCWTSWRNCPVDEWPTALTLLAVCALTWIGSRSVPR